MESEYTKSSTKFENNTRLFQRHTFIFCLWIDAYRGRNIFPKTWRRSLTSHIMYPRYNASMYSTICAQHNTYNGKTSTRLCTLELHDIHTSQCFPHIPLNWLTQSYSILRLSATLMNLLSRAIWIEISFVLSLIIPRNDRPDMFRTAEHVYFKHWFVCFMVLCMPCRTIKYRYMNWHIIHIRQPSRFYLHHLVTVIWHYTWMLPIIVFHHDGCDIIRHGWASDTELWDWPGIGLQRIRRAVSLKKDFPIHVNIRF